MMLERNHNENERHITHLWIYSHIYSSALKNIDLTYSMIWTLERHVTDLDHLKMTGRQVEALGATEAADQECLVPEGLLLNATSHSWKVFSYYAYVSQGQKLLKQRCI